MDFYFIFHKWSIINRTDFNMKQEQVITGEEIQAEMVDYCWAEFYVRLCSLGFEFQCAIIFKQGSGGFRKLDWRN